MASGLRFFSSIWHYLDYKHNTKGFWYQINVEGNIDTEIYYIHCLFWYTDAQNQLFYENM